MTELYHLMENELSNPELDGARMTELLKISRTKFYYKVKGLTGENPSVFFKTYKLNRAAELITEIYHLRDSGHDGIQYTVPFLDQLQETIWDDAERIQQVKSRSVQIYSLHLYHS